MLARSGISPPPPAPLPQSQTMIDVPDRQLVVLVANHAEWMARSLESVLEAHGYAVLRAEDGDQALALALQARPDAVILDASLPGRRGTDVCRALAGSARFDETVPIFITTPGPASNRERAEAYEAGAWEVASSPVDTETLLAKLTTFVRARRRVQLVEARSLIDPTTGLYSATGLYQWAAKMAARAARKREPLACVVVTADAVPAPETDAALTEVADFCRMQSRRSDVVGYMGENRVAILAPETDGNGARLLVERLNRVRASSTGERAAVPALRAGIYAVTDFSSEGITPSEVVDRASAALRPGAAGATDLQAGADVRPLH